MPPILDHAEATATLLALAESLSRACNDASIFLALVEAADLPPPEDIELDGVIVRLGWEGKTRWITLAFGDGMTLDGARALEWLHEGLKGT